MSKKSFIVGMMLGLIVASGFAATQGRSYPKYQISAWKDSVVVLDNDTDRMTFVYPSGSPNTAPWISEYSFSLSDAVTNSTGAITTQGPHLYKPPTP